MTFRMIAGLIHRQLLAVMVVLMVVAAAGYDVMTRPPAYADSATVVFAVRKALLGAAYPFSESGTAPLVSAEAMMAEVLTTSAAGQVRAAGGSAYYQLTPFNTYDQEYPDYAEPMATLTTTSPSPAAARRTCAIVVGLVTERLNAVQAGVPAGNRIRTYLVGETGPVSQPGSRTRRLAGLALLAIVGVFVTAGFLDRRRALSPARRGPRAAYSGATSRRRASRSG